MRFLLYIFPLVSAVRGFFFNSPSSPLVTEYEWKYFDYAWDERHQKDDYIRRGLYDYRNMTPIDIDRSSDGRTFVTIIRTGGVPATLNTISRKRGDSGPLLKPYPDWSWHSGEDCGQIINSYRVAIDECNRMWVLDTGVVDDAHVCPAKLLVFNLYNDRLLFTHVIPDNVAQNRNGTGLLITPVVETYGRQCERTLVYMADTEGFGLVVYDNGRTYRLENEAFEAESENSNFTIAGESFNLADGLFGLALTPLEHNPYKRFLAFRPLASTSLYGITTDSLKRFGGAINFEKGCDVLPSQATTMAFSSEGTLFYGLTGETAIGCWNANRPLKANYFKIAVQDPARLQFTSGLKVIEKTSFLGREEYLLMMTNRLQKIYGETMNFDEINFRVTRASVRDLIDGTVCDKDRNVSSGVRNFFSMF